MAKKPTYEELEQRIQELEQSKSEHKRTEAALRESESRYRSLFKNNHSVMLLINPETADIVDANPGAISYYGWSLEELTAKKITDINTLTGEQVFQEMEKAKSKQRRYFIFQHRLSNGDIRDVEVYTGPIKLYGQKLLYSIIHDISERKQAEDALRESETKHKALFNNMNGGVAVYKAKNDGEDFIFLDINKTGEKIDHVRKKDLIGKSVLEMFPGIKDFGLFDVFQRVWRTGQPVHHPITLYKDERLTGWRNNFIYKLPSGEVVAIYSDETESKQKEASLRESEEMFRITAEKTGQLLYSFDLKTGKVKWAGAVEAVTGYTCEEYQSFDADAWAEQIHPDDREMVLKTIDEAVEHRTRFDAEYRFRRKDGKYIFVEEHGAFVPGRESDPYSTVGTINNITDRKQYEEERRKAIEFAAEQSKLALIGQVAGKMAHDFNNVLMGIMGNAQLAIMDCDDKKIKVKLEKINEFSERGRGITNNLISFSKDQELKQTNFKIEDKIELVLIMLEKELKGIKVNRNYKPEISEFLADPGMIQDVLTNLIQNSIHAMSKVENPILNLKVYSQDDMVFLEIEDNGCGIPKEHQASIYTPSFTLKGSYDKIGSYKSGIKGTGYGMSNVKKYIVEKHKGDISLESEVGKGTKITIALKIIKSQLSPDEKKEVVKSQIYDKRRILLVEDEHAIADVQYQILSQEPFSHIVSMAVNGQTAIDSFDRNNFDAVSLDYMLPGNINGLDVYNHIRENNKDIPVMFISGNIEFLESMEKLKEKDPNIEHLSKPINNLDYVNRINELIGRSIK